MLSFYRIPRGVNKRWIESEITSFGMKVRIRKIPLGELANSVYAQGSRGLGVLDLEKMNIALLSKWLWKLFNEDGIWQKILRTKYLQKQTICQAVAKKWGLPFLAGVNGD
jgi:hypothetical protein